MYCFCYSIFSTTFFGTATTSKDPDLDSHALEFFATLHYVSYFPLVLLPDWLSWTTTEYGLVDSFFVSIKSRISLQCRKRERIKYIHSTVLDEIDLIDKRINKIRNLHKWWEKIVSRSRNIRPYCAELVLIILVSTASHLSRNEKHSTQFPLSNNRLHNTNVSIVCKCLREIWTVITTEITSCTFCGCTKYALE